MQVILNYKSYFEAFRLGVVNNGFKPVAEVLFYPLFRSHILLDAKSVPYEVNSQNASRWGNGQDPIQKEIQDAAGTDEKVVVTDPEHVEIVWKFKDEVRNKIKI